MNRLVAGFAGAFTDAVREAGADSRGITGAIFEHPDFERLETEARTPDSTDRLAPCPTATPIRAPAA